MVNGSAGTACVREHTSAYMSIRELVGEELCDGERDLQAQHLRTLVAEGLIH
jgi:hypothetical protein